MINYKNVVSTQEQISKKLESELFDKIIKQPFETIEIIDPKLDLSVANDEFLRSKLTNLVLAYPHLLTIFNYNNLRINAKAIFNENELAEHEKELVNKIITFDLSKENALKTDNAVEQYIQQHLMSDAEIDDVNQELKISYNLTENKHAIAITSWASKQENVSVKFAHNLVTLIIK